MKTEIGFDAEEFIRKQAHKEKERRDNLIEIEALKYLHKRFANMATKLEKKHIEIINERKAKELELVSQYASVDEAHEAFGWGIISEDEYQVIKGAFERGEAAEAEYTKESLAAFRIREFMRQCEYIRKTLEYECMSNEEKAEHDRNIEESEKHWQELKKQADKIREEQSGNIV